MKSIMWLLVTLLPCLVQALDAPVVGITATTDGDSVYVTLAWDPVLGAARYQVFRQDQFLGASALVSEYASSPFHTAVPTGWNWQQQPDILKLFKVEATDTPLHPVPMIRVPAGTFQMGQVGVAEPVHQVTLTHDFWLGETEVTNAQYLEALNWANDQGLVSVVGDYVQQFGMNLLRINEDGYDRQEIRYDNGSQQFYLHAGTYNSGSWGPGFAYPSGYDPANHPVEYASWFGAACFCDWLSLMNGLPAYYNGNWTQVPSPNNPYDATGYRLPTEAEWEYAAQFNDERTYPWGDTTPNCSLAAWGNESSGTCEGWKSPVGTHSAGASSLGLQDMASNVWEWNNDWYTYSDSNPQVDPLGSSSGDYRIRRGGCWINYPSNLACAFRGTSFGNPNDMLFGIGFRICKTAR